MVCDWELARRDDIERIAAEIGGEIKIPSTTNAFSHSPHAPTGIGQQRHDGSFAILDILKAAFAQDRGSSVTAATAHATACGRRLAGL